MVIAGSAAASHELLHVTFVQPWMTSKHDLASRVLPFARFRSIPSMPGQGGPYSPPGPGRLRSCRGSPRRARRGSAESGCP